MLIVDEFPNQHLKTLTNQINSWLSNMIQRDRLRVNPAKGAFELGEQFVMACLNDKEIRAVESLDKDLGELVTLTERRHHQIKQNKHAFAYARSLVNQDETLCQLFATKLAPNIAKALARLDKYENNSPEFVELTWRVRLVTIPTFHTHVFLIQRVENGSEVPGSASYIYVVSAPDWFNTLPRERLLRTKEFLHAFHKQTPILGIRGKTDVKESRI